MACTLTKGHSIDCRDSIGGIESVYISEFGNISAQTVVPGPFEITDIKLNQGVPDNNYEISWTPSAGAAGYLVEMTLLDYDISEILEIEKLYEIESGQLQVRFSKVFLSLQHNSSTCPNRFSC